MKTAFLANVRTAGVLGCFALSAVAQAATLSATNGATLTTALKNAKAGDVIELAAGTYNVATAVANVYTLDGVTQTSAWFFLGNKANITVRAKDATKKPVLRGNGLADGGYVFYAQKANNFKLQNVIIENGEKGLIVDRSNDVVIEGSEVRNIGWEGVHIRDGSLRAIIRNNYIHDIGLDRSDRGEGVYIGSDKKKWHPAYHVSGESNYLPTCDNALVENNTFGPNIGAEAIDIKEGVTGTTVRKNTFNMSLTATSITNGGQELADSAIDVKGTKSLIDGNTFNINSNANIGAAIDSFALIDQTDSPNTGYNVWGYNNKYINNKLSGDSATQYTVRFLSHGGGTVGCNTNALGPAELISRKASANTTVLTSTTCAP
jgi:hypothetical protein